jgi:NADP-dependent 3-hydroxy acid dehydrogenase YdfG
MSQARAYAVTGTSDRLTTLVGSVAGAPEVPIGADDIAATVCFVLESPAEVEIDILVVRPRRQLV